MQTSWETMDRLYRADGPERYCLRDNIWPDTMRKWTTQGYPTTEDGRPTDASDHFGFDVARCAGPFPCKAKLQEDEIVAQTEQWKIVRDGNGASFKWWKHKSGTPEHVDFLMSNRKMWEEEYKPHVVGSARKRATPERLERVRGVYQKARDQQKWLEMGILGLWENMRGSLGDMILYQSMLLDKEWIRDHCRTYTDLYLEELSIVLDEVGTPDCVWFHDDMGYKNATFCSPTLFGELIFPFYNELTRFCRGQGMMTSMHTCGYTEPLLDLIVEAGFDGVNPMEVKAGNDLFRIADRYAGKLVFLGGLDARILETHDRDHIGKEVTTLMGGMKERDARYVFGSDHSLSTIIDYQDFCYALEVYREHMML